MLVPSRRDSTLATRHALSVDIHTITPLQTSCSDDKDRPVAAPMPCGFHRRTNPARHFQRKKWRVEMCAVLTIKEPALKDAIRGGYVNGLI